MPEPSYFTEIFPLLAERLPHLTAYRLVLREEVSPLDRGAVERKIGGKLTYRLRAKLGGPWAWLSGHVLTGAPPNPVRLLMALDEIRRDGGPLYRDLESIEEDYGWMPTHEQTAEFAVRALAQPLLPEIQTALAAMSLPLRNAAVERDVRVRAWVIGAMPSLSLSIVSRLVYEPGLAAYAGGLKKITDLIGLPVADRLGGMQGEIIKVTGTLGEHRKRLLGLTQRSEMSALLKSSPADTWVVRVLSGSNEYDYAVTGLHLLIRPSDAARFDVDPGHAERALHLKPALRASVIKTASDILKGHGLIGSAFSTQNAAAQFVQIKPELELTFGGSRSRPYAVERAPLDFQQAGPYRSSEAASEIRIALINALDDSVDDFVEALRRSVEHEYGQKLTIVRERKLRVASQTNLESAVRLLAKEDAGLMLVFLPDEVTDDSGDGFNALYAKTQTIGRLQPCLVVHESTMHRPEALNGIILGLIARQGAIPYVLEEPLPFADRVVGLSLVRQSRKSKSKDRLTGISRIFKSDGELLSYVIAESEVDEHEGIPDTLLDKLLPSEWLQRKRAVLHIHGHLHRDESRALGAREADLDATFLSVEVNGKLVPRLYALDSGRIVAPPWGMAFIANPHEAMLLTSSAPSDATPQPLQVRIDPDAPASFTIEQALTSVVAFAALHYGVLQQPRLPVTLHHADLIAASVERGVLPTNASGAVPFWL
ncbi:MAG TPA: hypothetical protein VER79_15100 [Candidatus Limnocylindrales bacterium]|nr:hypothetical protein [Candidatus Limnocylindrales bacterium]